MKYTKITNVNSADKTPPTNGNLNSRNRSLKIRTYKSFTVFKQILRWSAEFVWQRNTLGI